jgi:hypothetical protein
MIKEERKIYNHNYYLKNKKQMRKNNIYWCKNNSEYHKQYDFTHKEHKKIYQKEYDEKNKLSRSNYSEKYYIVNKEKINNRSRKHHKTPRGKILQRISVYNRNKKLKNFSKFNLEKIGQVYKKCTNNLGEYICVCCFKPIIRGEEEIDHNIPISRIEEFPGIDLNNLNNLGLAHGKKSKINCNGKKYDKTLEEWFKKYPKLLERKNGKTYCY